ncbi:MAG: hypothetical protein IPQ05_02245 [Leptospiraceae bacterium]|nr:hypothetical protein [Leptospiraceae bacterium]
MLTTQGSREDLMGSYDIMERQVGRGNLVQSYTTEKMDLALVEMLI